MSDMKLKPIAAAMGLAFAGALAMSAMAVADVEDQPFSVEELERGYDLLADDHEGDDAEDDGDGDDGDAGEGGDDAGDDAEDDAEDDDGE